MADNVTVDNGDLTDYPVSSDEATSGQVQRVKLAMSANASDTHIPADADGLLVNLGVNNDVVVSGTVSVTEPVSVDDNGGSLTVDGTLTVEQPTAANLNARVVGLTAHDGAAASTNPLLVGGYASAAAPADVSADTDAVRQWHLRNGSQVVNLASGGTLVGGVAAPLNVQLSDGVDTATVRDLTNGDALNVAIVDASGNQITSFGGGSGASKTDEAAWGIGTDAVAPAGFLADETTPDSVAEGQVGLARMTLDRKVLTRVVGATDANRLDVDASGHAQVDIAAASVTVPVSDAGGSLTVDGTVTAVASGDHTVVGKAADGAAVSGNPVLIAGQDGTNVQSIKTDTNGELQVDVLTLPALVAGTANIGDVDVLTVPAPLSTAGGGTEAAALRVTVANDSTGVLSVDDNGGSLTVDQGAAGTAWEVVGDVAHDVAAPANPVVVGGQMETPADSAPGTRAGTDGDAVKLASVDGAQFMIPGTPQQWSYHSDGSTALTDATVHAAPGAGLSLYVTTIVVSTGAATALNVFFEEGASKVLGPYYLEAVAGRGFVINFAVPKKITANTALTVTTSAAIAQAVDVTGFIAPG